MGDPTENADYTERLRRYLPYVAPGGLVVLICPQERGYASDPTHVQYTDLAGLRDIAGQLDLEVHTGQSFPLPRAAGKVFPYNEFLLTASRRTR